MPPWVVCECQIIKRLVFSLTQRKHSHPSYYFIDSSESLREVDPEVHFILTILASKKMKLKSQERSMIRHKECRYTMIKA